MKILHSNFRGWLAHLASFKWHTLSLALFLIPIAFLGRLEFDYALEKFLATDDPLRDQRDAHFEAFGSDYDFFVLTMTGNEGFSEERLVLLDTITQQLTRLEHVKEVYSLTNVKELYFIGDFPSYRPLIKNKKNAAIDSVRLYESGEWIKDLVSEDGRSHAVFVRTSDNLTKQASDELLAGVKKVLSDNSPPDPRIIGKLQAQETYINLIINQTVLFVVLGTLGMLIYLVWFMRSLSLPILFLLIAALATGTCLGSMAMFGKKIDAMVSAVPVIMLAIGLADILHLQSAFRRSSISNFYDRVIESYREAGLPAVLTSITTAIGFFTLQFSNLQPVKEFGVWAGIAVLISCVIILLAHPLMCSFKGSFGPDNRYMPSVKKARYLRLTFLILTLISIPGIFTLKTNIFLIDDLRDSNSMKQDFAWFDENMGGVRPLELVIPVELDNVDAASIKAWEKKELALKNAFGCGPVRSVLHLLRSYNRALHFGKSEYYSIPESDLECELLWEKAKNAGMAKGLKEFNLLDENETRLRFSARMPDVGSLVYTQLTKDFYRLDGVEASDVLSGTADLVDRSLDYLSNTLISSLFFSVAGIGIIFLLLEGSFKTMLAALLVNILPLLWLLALMGLAGIYLRASNAIVFGMVLGISADDSLHVLWRFRKLKKQGLVPKDAIMEALRQTRPALVATTRVLLIGFLPMLFSPFLGNVQMGIITALGLLFALYLDLYLLPYLIQKLYPVKSI